MYCTNCGVKLRDGASFCMECGAAAPAQTQTAPAQTQTAPAAGYAYAPGSAHAAYPGYAPALIGFSAKIHDPAFAKYRKKSVAWSMIFSIILALIAVIGFPIYGKSSGEIDWPESLYYGLGIGGMFIVIALLQTLKRSMDRTWDGEVIYKDTYRKREHDTNSDITHVHTIYVLKIQKKSGGKKKHKWRDTPGLYNYYSVGDQVRHHKGFHYYEKYDKSKDSHILCAACNSFQEIEKDFCSRCKCPLLK